MALASEPRPWRLRDRLAAVLAKDDEPQPPTAEPGPTSRRALPVEVDLLGDPPRSHLAQKSLDTTRQIRSKPRSTDRRPGWQPFAMIGSAPGERRHAEFFNSRLGVDDQALV
jgi:hypothetical protein